MYVPRPSILKRPVRESSRVNEEHAEGEYAREQARLAAKTHRLAAAEERLLTAAYATQEDKRRAWGHAQREAEQLAAARAAVVTAERQRDAAYHAEPQRVVVDPDRPWTAASSTYYLPPEVEDEARRRVQREDAEVNRGTAARRAASTAQQRAAEQAALHASIVSEDCYFNLGAASERWVPPERRIKQRAGVPPQFAPAPPPYCCDDDELPARAGRPSAACTSRSEAYGPPPSHQQQQRPNTASRRALEGQGVAAALRHDEVVAPRGSSFSAATGYSGMQGGYAASYGASSAAAAAQARPQTAPVAAQRQYPWSWGGPQ